MRRVQVTREATLAEMERLADAPEFILCRFHELVHERSTTAGSCPCCGSDTSKVAEDLPDFELLLDTVEGERYLRGPMFPESRS